MMKKLNKILDSVVEFGKLAGYAVILSVCPIHKVTTAFVKGGEVYSEEVVALTKEKAIKYAQSWLDVEQMHYTEVKSTIGLVWMLKGGQV